MKDPNGIKTKPIKGFIGYLFLKMVASGLNGPEQKNKKGLAAFVSTKL